MMRCDPSSTPLANQPPAVLVTSAAGYRLRLAKHDSDVRLAQRLRFEVFNLELNEGLAKSFESGLDADPFDAVCDHLLVETADGSRVVGTYRMQSGARALTNLGYYSEREFSFLPYEPMRAQMLELGRACIAADHRNFSVLNLLWKGITVYAKQHQLRYLVGCSSLTSQSPSEGAAAYQRMEKHWAPLVWQTQARSEFICSLDVLAVPAPKIPRLLSAYLSLGAKICSPPAIDREFGTIDFLTLVDLQSTSVVAALQVRGRFGG